MGEIQYWLPAGSIVGKVLLKLGEKLVKKKIIAKSMLV